MNIYVRILIAILLTGLASITLPAIAEGNQNMNSSLGLTSIQNTIQKIASLHGNEVHVEWTKSNDNEFMATIHSGSSRIQIHFSDKEIKNAIHNESLSFDTLNKITHAVSKLPPRDWPPATKSHE
jgi:hypothetical protein